MTDAEEYDLDIEFTCEGCGEKFPGSEAGEVAGRRIWCNDCKPAGE